MSEAYLLIIEISTGQYCTGNNLRAATLLHHAISVSVAGLRSTRSIFMIYAVTAPAKIRGGLAFASIF